ncbi:MAG TPA: sugar phosphate isomerase/epimerase family protein [Verrucomicrobiae bacterium]|jgi:sugar phosphate isomerase/epimerase|nr:sugar phosphate isomerase/epimerase family protein [Verrucomicrobiae bacterium]
MKSAVTISLVPEAVGGPFVFWEGLADGCRRAALLGFDAIEIFPASAAAIDVGLLEKLLRVHNLKLAAVGTGAGWLLHKWSLTHWDTEVRAKARAFVREIMGVAARFGAPAIIGSIQGRIEGEVTRSQALNWLTESLNQLCDAGPSEARLLCEPLNRYETNLLNRLEQGAEVLESAGNRRVKLLADLFHMNIEERSIPDALRACAKYIGHVHFADTNRRAVGFGHTDMVPIFQALRDIGYNGCLSAEILPLPDSEKAARQTIESFRKFAT